MEFSFYRNVASALAMLVIIFTVVFKKIIYSWWIGPYMAYQKLKRNGLSGPSPSFPLGNIPDIKASKKKTTPLSKTNVVSHDFHSNLYPHFAQWQKSYGKVFIYWLGIEPFLYVADPRFIKRMSSDILAKRWGKPSVIRDNIKPLLGNGMGMAEGDDWLRQRNKCAPAFTPPNLKAMESLIVAPTIEMLDQWTSIINTGQQEIDVFPELVAKTGEIIAKAAFGMDDENAKQLCQKLTTTRHVLYSCNHFLGVPFGKLLFPRHYMKAKRLGREMDALIISVLNDGIKSMEGGGGDHGSIASNDGKKLLDIMLTGDGCSKGLFTTSELVDNCKTFFAGGQDTTALALTWTLCLLARHPEWQNQLREEIKQVVGDQLVDVTMLHGLKKMGWVMNEVLRLYPPATAVHRQARDDIRVDDAVITKGTNIWIDVLAMHHDSSLWGDTVNEFKPERFEADSLYGGCSNKLGYMPFGYGGRMCIGKNLSIMEYKIMLTLILTSFSFSLSPYYTHSPTSILTLKPSKGMPLLVHPLKY